MNYALLNFLDANRVNVFAIYLFLAQLLRCFDQILIK